MVAAAAIVIAGRFLGDQETSCSANHSYHIAATADRYTVVERACAMVAADCSPGNLDLDSCREVGLSVADHQAQVRMSSVDCTTGD